MALVTAGRKTEKIMIIVSKEWLQRVDDFRFKNRLNSRSEAIRRLVDKGLEDLVANEGAGEAED